MAFAEDLAPFFGDFAQTVTIAGRQAQAIVDMPFALGDVGEIGMATTAPRLTVRTAEIDAGTVVGSQALVGDERYVVAEHRPDGTGVSALLLGRAT